MREGSPGWRARPPISSAGRGPDWSTGPGWCTTSAGSPCHRRLGAAGAAAAEEWELVRLHPYHTGRILARSPVLAPLGLIAARHHERMDGRGYPAGCGDSELDTSRLPAGRGRRLPRAGRAAAASRRPLARRRRPHASCPGCRSTATRSGPCSPPPARRRPPCRALPAGLTERELESCGCSRPGRRNADRRRAGDLAVDRAHAHGAHLRQVRRLDPGRRWRCSRCGTARGQDRGAAAKSTEQSMVRAAAAYGSARKPRQAPQAEQRSRA